MDKKYEFTNETLEWRGRTLHRIRALRDFGNVKAGDLGGWVESENNLSHRGTCWLYDEAKAYDSASLTDDACACNYSCLFDNARVSDYSHLSDNACASGNAHLSGNAHAYNYAEISGDAHLSGSAKLFGFASVCGTARLSGDMYATQDVVYIGGLGRLVTISDNHIRIDNLVRTTNEWATSLDREIAATSPGTLGFWERWKSVIMTVALEHRKGEE